MPGIVAEGESLRNEGISIANRRASVETPCSDYRDALDDVGDDSSRDDFNPHSRTFS